MVVKREISSVSSKSQEEDLKLIELSRMGSEEAITRLIEKYLGFIKLKASSYFIAGGENEDLVQEGMVGLYKAIKDYRCDREASFRSFAELCVTRQIITAVKTASRGKHSFLNNYLSLYRSSATDENDCSLEGILPGSSVNEPDSQVIVKEEVDALNAMFAVLLSDLEMISLNFYLEGLSYEQISGELKARGYDSDTKSVDNALQRIKRKVDLHLKAREVF